MKKKNGKTIPIEEAVIYLVEYWEMYDDQPNYTEFRDDTFIDDALYGIGKAIDPEKYGFAEGYKRFKDFLRDYLKEGDK